MSNKYIATIGLEMHCEISKTKSKVFSAAKNEYTDIPNSNIRPLDMGFPGTLPVLNKKCVEMSIMMSEILHCQQPEYMYFERKNYYYPDMPKNYQITQNPPEECVGMGGYVDITREDGSTFRVEIDNYHLEEDAAAMNHLEDISTIDYNRAGVPLLELVTKPCIHSADDAVLFLEYMRQVYQYCDISEADSKKGQIRCDVNVSISDNENELGTKVETKNVNSFRAVHDSISYEIDRQTELKEEGRYDEVVQETKRWDEESGKTITMRSKEDAEDYKYFVEPNIPKFKLEKSWLEKIKNQIPVLPYERIEKYTKEYKISSRDAKIIVKEKPLADYFEETVSLGANPQSAANWINSIILGHLNKMEKTIEELFLTPKMLKGLIDLVETSKISGKQAKEVLTKSLEEEKDPVKLVSELGMSQITDEAELTNIIKEVIEENPTQLESYKKNPKLFDYFVGQVMKKTRGKANPALSAKILKQELDK